MFARLMIALTLITMVLGVTALEPKSADASLATFGPTYLSANVCCSSWYTFGAIYASQIGEGESIRVVQANPTTRPCHWRVYFRISGPGNDFHGATYTTYYGQGYLNIARAPMPDGLVRADIQGDCDSYNGIMAGYVKTSF